MKKTRKQIEQLVERWQEMAKYDELGEDELVQLWMLEKMLVLTKDMAEPVEEKSQDTGGYFNRSVRMARDMMRDQERGRGGAPVPEPAIRWAEEPLDANLIFNAMAELERQNNNG